MYLFISYFVCKHFVPSFKPTSPRYKPALYKPKGFYATANPLLSPLRGLFILGPFEGGGLFNLEKTMVSVLHKKLE